MFQQQKRKSLQSLSLVALHTTPPWSGIRTRSVHSPGVSLSFYPQNSINCFFFFCEGIAKKQNDLKCYPTEGISACLYIQDVYAFIIACISLLFFFERKENIDRRWWAMIIRERRTEHAKRRGKKRENLFSFLFLFYTCIDASPKVSSRVHTWSESWLELFSFNSKKTKYPCPPLLFQRLLCVCTFKKKEKKSARELKPYLDGRIYTLYSTSWLCSQKWDFSSGVLFEIFSKFPAQSFLT